MQSPPRFVLRWLSGADRLLSALPVCQTAVLCPFISSPSFVLLIKCLLQLPDVCSAEGLHSALLQDRPSSRWVSKSHKETRRGFWSHTCSLAFLRQLLNCLKRNLSTDRSRGCFDQSVPECSGTQKRLAPLSPAPSFRGLCCQEIKQKTPLRKLK